MPRVTQVAYQRRQQLLQVVKARMPLMAVLPHIQVAIDLQLQAVHAAFRGCVPSQYFQAGVRIVDRHAIAVGLQKLGRYACEVRCTARAITVAKTEVGPPV